MRSFLFCNRGGVKDTIPAGGTAVRPEGHPARPTDVLVARGGGKLAVHPAGPGDFEAAAGLHGRCSVGSLRQRYRGRADDADAYLPHLLSAHFGHTHTLWDGDEAEVALLVEDAWQRRGVGAGLLRRLVGAAGRTGRTRVYAVAQLPRTGMAALMRGLGQPADFRYEQGAVVITASTVRVSVPWGSPRPGRRCGLG